MGRVLLPASRRTGASGFGVAILLLLTLGVTSGCTSAPVSDAPADATGVLQSVAIGVGPGGQTTSVATTNVFTLRAEGSSAAQTRTTTGTFAPKSVVRDLPVRVLTSWSSGGKTGTNLADLAGRSGPVEIDLTVQNLTQKSARVSYDVAGSSRTETSPVSVPLTVVASAALKGTGPAQITVASPSAPSSAVTNGIVSPSEADGSTVQWAAVLAPPQLAASATLRLVVDAEKFAVPTFTIAVQPGIQVDASAGGLIGGVLNPTGPTETASLARTIQLVADIDSVLGQASSTVSQIATSLDSTGSTLGRKTVTELTGSATTLTRALDSVSRQAVSLGSSLSSGLASTQSSLLTVLQETVTRTAAVLGDTTTAPAPATITGSGCSAAVSGLSASPSVYGTLMRVVGELNAHAQVDQGCKRAIQDSLVTLIGTPAPDAASCAGVTSLSCSVYAAGVSLDQVAADLKTAGAQAVASLDLALTGEVANGYAALSAGIDRVEQDTTALAAAGSIDDESSLLARLQNTLTTLTGTDLPTVNTAIGGIHSRARTASQGTGTMQTQSQSLVAQLCGLIGDGTLTPGRGAALLSYLTPSSGAPGTCAPGGTPAPLGPSSYAVTPLNPGESPLADELTAQARAWADVMAATAPSAADPSTADILTPVKAQIHDIEVLLGSLQTMNGDNLSRSADLTTKITALRSTVNGLVAARNALSPKVHALVQQQQGLGTAITSAFDSAAQTASGAAAQALSHELGQLNNRLGEGLGELDTRFGQSSIALTGAAGTIHSEGEAAIAAQETAITAAAHDAGVSVSGQVTGDLRRIAASVAASTTDLGAANALLTADLQHVLLDLGGRDSRTGLLGLISTGSATANSANSALALASQTGASYTNVRSQDIAGIRLRSAQTQAALRAQAGMPPFHLSLPADVEHRSVYVFTIGSAQ